MFYPVLIVLPLTMVAVAGEDCSLYDNGPNKAYKEELLKKIKPLSNNKLVVESGGYSYALDVCHEVSKDHPKAAVTRSSSTDLKKSTIVLGRYSNTDIIGRDDWIILTYASGDKVVDNTTCNGSEWRAMILMTCDEQVKENDQLHLLERQSNSCSAQFQLKISLLCPEKSWSGAAIFFTLLALGLFLYFTLGIIYRRFILGAKGYEQVPNYELWSSILALPRELLMRLLSGDGPRHETMDSSQPIHRSGQPMSQDAADEPLLSP